jgi:hypothetical protein
MARRKLTRPRFADEIIAALCSYYLSALNKLPENQKNIFKASLKHPQNIAKTSPKHRQNIP